MVKERRTMADTNRHSRGMERMVVCKWLLYHNSCDTVEARLLNYAALRRSLTTIYRGAQVRSTCTRQTSGCTTSVRTSTVLISTELVPTCMKSSTRFQCRANLKYLHSTHKNVGSTSLPDCCPKPQRCRQLCASVQEGHFPVLQLGWLFRRNEVSITTGN